MKTHVLEHSQIIERSLKDTFDFFSDAFNLEKITPEFLRFKILTPRPLAMKAGALIEYSLSLFGIPFKWKTLIEAWEPGVKFVDRQLKGPYALWVHTHTFEAIGADRTLMKDRVEYQIPLGFLGEIAHTLFVRQTLEKIFAHRSVVTARLLTPATQTYSVSGAKSLRPKLATDSGD
jgi:ligand-binding SRPBCC domain-containing protein